MDIQRFFTWTDNPVRRITNWYSLTVIVGGAMTAVFNAVTAVAQYGWAAIVLAAIFATAVLALCVCASLALWRYFHPLPILAASSETGKQAAPPINTEIDAQIAHDLLLLLHFSVDYTTVLFLDDLWQSLSDNQPFDPMKSNPTRHSDEVIFLRRVRSALAETGRKFDLSSIMKDAEIEAEAKVKMLAQDKLPPHLNLLQVREWAISRWQSNCVLVYLLDQKHQVEAHLRSQRAGLSERLALRNPS